MGKGVFIATFLAWTFGVTLATGASARSLLPIPTVHPTYSTLDPRSPLLIPSPSASSLLYGIVCVRRAGCWAVGYYTASSGAQLGQALRLNRGAWSSASVPQPGGTGSGDVSNLRAISCPTATACWAVGNYGNAAGAQLNEVLHWNGSRWSRATPPQPGGQSSGAINNLDAIACSSKTNCWAVGVFTGPTGGFLNETLHWNGRKWTYIRAPDPGGTGSTAFNILEGVACTLAAGCRAVGDFETSAYFNQALRWNGRKWSLTTTPQPGGSYGSNLVSLSCDSTGRCWAVGGFNTSGGAALNQALRWNGQRWKRAAPPQPGGTALNDQSGLTGVSCDSTQNCWAVGYFETALGPDQNEALRWNGHKWSLFPTPNPGGTATGDSNQLQAVSCVSASNCWAVGNYGDTSGTFNLALHWNGHRWLAG